MLGFFAGGIVMATGYGEYFVITVVSVAPAMLLFMYLWPHFRRAEIAVVTTDEPQKSDT